MDILYEYKILHLDIVTIMENINVFIRKIKRAKTSSLLLNDNLNNTKGQKDNR